MLKPEQNKALMEVGPRTLMGNLLRWYWTPFAAAGELEKTPIKPVRLMGEVRMSEHSRLRQIVPGDDSATTQGSNW